VLGGLREKLLAPAAVAEAVGAFQVETNRRNRERRAAADAVRRAVESAERKIKEIVSVIENGGARPATPERLDKLERERRGAQARLRDMPDDLPVIHPKVAEIYRAKVARLSEALRDPATALEAAEDIRGLVGKVILKPGPGRGQIDAVLHGELGAILELVAQKGESRAPGMGVRLSVVARARNYRESSLLAVAI
jgi:site-specific DNA recombinase